MDIMVWLRSLGLGKYEAAFRENEIDETVLPSLTEEHLNQLGVTALGHRVKLLDAIAGLRNDASGKAPSVDAATTSSAPSASPEDRAERRQVTLMFSDLVGSTALSARMDPEDLREVISAYQTCVAETVQRCGGFVAKYMGDGVLVYFGYPQAHEDDAERAVRAGLELVAAVSALKTHAPLQTRVGIATGLVVVGDLIGSGASQEQAIVGETPNLAARLQGVAEPNSVVIAESTVKLVGNLFEVQDLGAKDLKGISGPVKAWVAVRPSSAESRFEAFHASGVTELVGREEELELLLRRWSKAKSGEGQVVLLSGEPGIGKSRLTAALLERIGAEPHTRLRYFCSPQRADSALYPIISQMERAAGFEHADTVPVKLNKLDALLVLASTSKQDAALFAEMLSLPNDGHYPALELTPQQRRQKTLKALTAQLEALSRSIPVLMIFEDAHWIDPTSLEAVALTVERLRALPVFLVLTYRPEFEPPWIGRPNVTTLTLNRLTEREIDAMIDRVTGNKPLSVAIKHDIIERTDGVPLFVEEMTKAVLDAGDAAEQIVVGVTSPSGAVPASLHASLMSRLDRLGDAAGEVAQIGAAIGREFSHALLFAVARKPSVEFQTALDRLIGSGLLFRRGPPPDATYLFKHALVRDMAYATLLRGRRQALHSRIAQTLEKQFHDAVELEPEILAQHYFAAGLVEQAVPYWLKAGTRAAHRSANQEAIRHLQKGLEHLSVLPETPDRFRQELAFQTVLGPAMLTTIGWGAPEALATYRRARKLSEKLGDIERLFASVWGMWLIRWARGQIAIASGLVEELLDLARRDGNTVFRLQAHHAGWTTCTYLGDLKTALYHAEQGVAIYRRDEHSTLAIGFGGHDPGVCARAHASQPLWLIGYPDKALHSSQQSLTLAQELSHSPSVTHALFHGAWLHQFRRDERATREQAEALVARATDQGQTMYLAMGTIFLGWASAFGGAAEIGIGLMRQGLHDYRATGAQSWVPYYGALLAEQLGQAGFVEEASAVLNEARDAAKRASDRVFWGAELLRLEGELRLCSRSREAREAEKSFRSAITMARDQHAKSLELRSCTSLARLWRDQGKVSEARELLAPVYGWFTEGFDTRDLKEAKALLEQLAT